MTVGTVADPLGLDAIVGGTVTFVRGGALVPVEKGALLDAARRHATVLSDLGADIGSEVVLRGSPTPELVATILGVLLLGASFSVTAQPGDEVEVVGRARLPLDDLARRAASAAPIEARAAPDAVAVRQRTSGSTAEPRTVGVRYAAVAAHAEAVAAAAGLSGDDVFVSWLPLHHDMGLIGFLLTPFVLGIDLVLLDPAQFVARPASWLEAIAATGGTVTGGPNFAYAHVARRPLGASCGLDRLRLAFNGAEPVTRPAVDAFVAATEPLGFRPRAMFPVYGMAEATLAVSFPEPGSGARFDHLGRAILGRPIPGVELRVVDPEHRMELPAGMEGELEIRGPSIATRYLEDGPGPERGWLATGDLGYLLDGEVVVSGRLKELIIVAGRNLLPTDVEEAARTAPGVRAGGVAAFGVPVEQGEGVVVVAEPDGTATADVVREGVRRAVSARVGVTPVAVVVVDRGWVPKTSSGKVRRVECRRRYLEGDVEV